MKLKRKRAREFVRFDGRDLHLLNHLRNSYLGDTALVWSGECEKEKREKEGRSFICFP